MAIDPRELTAQSNKLRLELKQWEKKFAAANNGRKAGRDDIKMDAAIAAKYKEYNRIREVLRNTSAHASPPGASRKRKAADQPAQTPSKTRFVDAVSTSRKAETQTHQVEDAPDSAQRLFTPSIVRMVIGPTPHRDGKVLGLFDLLSPRNSEASPIKSIRAVLGAIEPNTQMTPSKSRLVVENAPEDFGVAQARGSRTPASSGRRFLLSTFVTPSKRKLDGNDEQNHATPCSVPNEHATPTFLRRTSHRLETVAEESVSTAAEEPPWKRRGVARSLSTMIAGLRQMEEDRLDEEMDILRELEGDGVAAEHNGRKSTGEVLVEDSQNWDVIVPGPDGFEGSGDESEGGALPPDALDANGNPRKVWKKKGLKRQTRRVNMRPVRLRPKRAPNLATVAEEDEHGDGLGADMQTVAETQTLDIKDGSAEKAEDGDALNNSDTSGARRGDQAHSEPTSKSLAKGNDGIKAKDGVVKKAARMISAQAHANFRALKIKNKNSKAKGRGRFGRGR